MISEFYIQEIQREISVLEKQISKMSPFYLQYEDRGETRQRINGLKLAIDIIEEVDASKRTDKENKETVE